MIASGLLLYRQIGQDIEFENIITPLMAMTIHKAPWTICAYGRQCSQTLTIGTKRFDESPQLSPIPHLLNSQDSIQQLLYHDHKNTNDTKTQKPCIGHAARKISDSKQNINPKQCTKRIFEKPNNRPRGHWAHEQNTFSMRFFTFPPLFYRNGVIKQIRSYLGRHERWPSLTSQIFIYMMFFFFFRALTTLCRWRASQFCKHHESGILPYQ